MSELSRVFDPSCGLHHLALVQLDDQGFPTTEFVQRCPRDLVGEWLADSGHLLAMSLERGFEPGIVSATDILSMNDPEEP
jgi:hypothetical protein